MGAITTGESGGGQRVINGYPVHPAAEVYPLMTGDHWEAFLDDVRRTMKVDVTVVLYEGQILDGRNRERAIEIVERETGRKVEVTRVEFGASNGELPSDFVKRRNFHRRHMTPDQLAASAVKLHGQRERELSERRQKASQFGSKPDDATAAPEMKSPPEAEEGGPRKRNPTTAQRIASDQGIKKHRVEKALKIQKEQGEAALDKMLNGEISLNTALGATKKAVVELTIPEQVAKSWKSMKQKFAVADLPEVRKEFRKLLKAEEPARPAAKPKSQLVKKQPTPPPFNGMGFVLRGPI
jgi:hypothetical protein